MIVLDSGDAIRGYAGTTELVDFIINGYVGTTATQLADGQLTNSEADLYASSADATVVTSIILCNLHSSALAVHLYLKPSGGTSRSIISKDMSLAAGYSIYTDGQRTTTLDTSGNITTTLTKNLGDLTDVTLTSEADHDMLYYDNATSLWKNATVAVTLGQLTGANFDVGAFDVRGQTLTADSLASGRVVYTGANGVLSIDSGFNYAASTLTVSKITTGDVASLCGTKAVFNSWGAVFGDAYYLYMRSDYSAYVASIDSNYLDISGNTGLRMRVSDVGVIFSISASSCAMYPPTTFSAGVIILPEAEFKLRLPVTDTVGTIEGEVWYDASENTIKVVTGSIDSVVLQAATQTLTNKTVLIDDSGYIQIGDTSGHARLIPWSAAEGFGGFLLQPSAGDRIGWLALQPKGTEDRAQMSWYNCPAGEGSDYGAFSIKIDGAAVAMIFENVGSPATPVTELQLLNNWKTKSFEPVTDTLGSLGTTAKRYWDVVALHHELTQALATDHYWSGITAPMTAGTALTRTQAVYVGGDSKMELADADATTWMPVVALVADATIAENAIGEFLLQGFFRDNTWDWTIGGIIYASVTPGALSQTAPVGSGDQVQVVGVAITADIIYFNPSLELVEIS